MHAVPSWELVGSHDGTADAQSAPLPAVTEFALTLNDPPQQTDLRNANPLCALAARTRAGMAVCNQGCGIRETAVGAVHACVFGLEMRCAEVSASGARWSGRRFGSAQAMHQALELLELNGIERDEILAHLPDEPIAAPRRMRPAAADPAPAAPVQGDHAGHLLEYVEQIHRLISSAGKREEVCNRFLRALCGAVPFDGMAIYLADGEELVLTATADRESRTRPKAHPCRPAADSLEALALARACTLVENNAGAIEPLAGAPDQPVAVAIALAGKARPLGVWVSRRGGTPFASPIQRQPIRLMHLLAELLAERLEREAAPAGGEVVAIENPDHKLFAELRAEVARATRIEGAVALLRVVVDTGRGKARLPAEALGEALAGAVRPYDRVAAIPGEPCAWWVMGAHAAAEDARAIATRLVATLEDVMDAHGGAEELGVAFRVGISVWGDDAASADELVAHATAAAAENTGELINPYRVPCLVMDDHG
ncbi:MAG: hypothetical protein ABFD69_12895 [Candidatus Sumerlaeia bacterium]